MDNLKSTTLNSGKLVDFIQTTGTRVGSFYYLMLILCILDKIH